MFKSFTLNNIIAFGIVFLAKISGIVGVILAFKKEHHFLGGLLLILDGLLLVAAVALCIVEMRRQNQEDDKNNNIVVNMLQNGSLQYLLQESGFKIVKK